MNIKQVKARWTLVGLLQAMGHSPDVKKSKGHDLWYKSPFRTGEKEPSFHVHNGHDIWKDFGMGGKSGGDLLYFVQKLLEEQGRDNSISAALEWFKDFSGDYTSQIPLQTPVPPSNPKEAAFKLLSVKPIFSKALFNYLAERGISKEVGSQFLSQVYFVHRLSGRRIYGLGMQNEQGGYEVRNPLGFKGVLGKKAISFVSAHSEPTKTIDVYEGLFDFLSGVELAKAENKPRQDSIVMHTSTLYEPAAALIKEKGYSKARLWLDNDKAGIEGRAALVSAFEGSAGIESMNDLYAEAEDLNAWYVQTFKLGHFA